MDRPDEVHPVAAARLDQFADLRSLLLRVGKPPVRAAVVGVVLRSVKVGVHLEASVEVDQRQAHLMRPRRTVEALDHTAVRKVRMVVDARVRQPHTGRGRAFEQLAERLDAVEGAAFVVADDPHALRVDVERIGSRDALHATTRCGLLPEVDVQLRSLRGKPHEAEVIVEAALTVFQPEALRDVEPMQGVELHPVRRRVDDDAAVVPLVARHGRHLLRLGTLCREVKVGLLCRQRAAQRQAK